MPHDLNGDVLQVGDIVSLDCRVTSVMAGEEYCNVTVETVNPPNPPECAPIGPLTGNTRQFIKVRTPAEILRLAMPQQQPEAPEAPEPEAPEPEAPEAPEAPASRPKGWVSFGEWCKRGLDMNDYPRSWRDTAPEPNPDSTPGGSWSTPLHHR